MLNYIKCNLVNKIWYQRHFLAYALLPFSGLYYLIITIRKALYKLGIKKITKFKVPVIIVGNITVGGTGKTPLVIWLAEFLRQQGFKPGIISRGYGGKNITYPYVVTPNSDAAQVGDEPLLIARRTKCTVVIAPKRVVAAQKLLASSNCNIIISDDGLQHYALGRDLEIAVLDGARRLGNDFLLPAGPLREPKNRLNKVDLIVVNGDNMQLIPENVIKKFKGKTVHAVAAIGNPQRFFQMLQSYNIEVIAHPFPDHHVFTATDLAFNDDLPILMTEKDAVKCENFSNAKYFCIPVTAELNKGFQQQLLNIMC